MEKGTTNGGTSGSERSILMMGDSITEGFDTQRLLHRWNITNRGVSGDSTEECIGRIRPEWFTPAPSRVYLCIGTNDIVRDRDDATIVTGIERIVECIRLFAQPEIHLTSIFPTRGNEPRPNERIRALNKAIEALAERKGCRYFDIHARFTDGAGDLQQAFTDDGLHLTEVAYRLWSALLDEELQRDAAMLR